MAETYLTELDYNGVTHIVKDKSALTSSSSLNPSNLSSAVPVTKGGTGATSASSARSSLGLGSAATKDYTSDVSDGGTSLITDGGVYEAIKPLSCRRVLLKTGNSSATYTYTINKGDFYVSGDSSAQTVGVYLISIVTWGQSPSLSLYMVGYSGNNTSYSSTQKIAGADASVSVSGSTITITTSGKVSIFALK